MNNPICRVFSLLLVAVVVVTGCQATDSGLGPIAADTELPAGEEGQSGAGSSAPIDLQMSGNAAALNRTIAIDGKFSDWAGVEAAMYPTDVATTTDVNDQLISNPNDFYAAYDADWLYLRFGLGEIANLQGLANTLALELDVDGSPLTGVIRPGGSEGSPGMPGVDYTLVFSPQSPQSGRTGGVAAAAFERGVGSTTLHPYTLDASFAPTFAHDKVELRIRRDIELPGMNIRTFTESMFNARLVITNSETATVTAFPSVAVTFENRGDQTADEMAPISTSTLQRPGGTIRVMSWNVERGRPFEDPAPFARIIRAVNPHVICFQEIGDKTSAADLQRWLETNARASEGWSIQTSRGSGTAIATRIASVRTGPITMPTSASTSYPIRNSMLLVASEGRRIVVSSIHLKCCGRAGDGSDQKRINETAVIKQLIADAVAEDHANGILIMGDFNLVGSRIPLDNLAVGTDLNGTNLRDVAPLRLNDRTNTTWRDSDQPYLPGRLDLALISDSTIKVRNSFLLDTELLSAEELERYKLNSADTTNASDHLPLIVDLK